MNLTEILKVDSPLVKYVPDAIIADYQYETVLTQILGNEIIATPKKTKYTFKTETKVPKVGVMMVGLGGNNGSTVTAGIIANREGISWRTKNGVRTPNYYGSVTQSSTIRLGANERGEDFFLPLNKILPMLNPNDMVIGGWDINKADLAEAMERAKVLDYDLQRQLIPYLKEIKPLPSIYYPEFIAANQADRANNLIPGTKQQHLDRLRQDIRDFKKKKRFRYCNCPMVC